MENDNNKATQTAVAEPINKDVKESTVTDNKAKSNSSFTDNSPVRVPKQVTIFRREGNSAYFNRNMKMMPESKNRIGSGINSVDRMKSNLEELAVYMPTILGCSATDPKYTERLDNWFNNISKLVPEHGLTLEIGFVYKNQSVREPIEDVEKNIFNKFTASKKNTSEERDLAFKIRDDETIALEGTKYKYGFPINVGEYILWRYCLVYSSVANDIALTNKSGAIRFYIHDSAGEKYKEELQFAIRKKAAITYVKLLDEPSKVNDILWLHMGENTEINKLSDIDKFKAIETLSKVNPDELVRFYEDSSLTLKSRIERMIHYGILRRLQGTSVIVDENNDTIGNDMASVIAFFKNTEQNKAAITRFTSKLNNYIHD